MRYSGMFIPERGRLLQTRVVSATCSSTPSHVVGCKHQESEEPPGNANDDKYKNILEFILKLLQTRLDSKLLFFGPKPLTLVPLTGFQKYQCTGNLYFQWHKVQL